MDRDEKYKLLHQMVKNSDFNEDKKLSIKHFLMVLKGGEERTTRKVYIAGKINGLKNYREIFKEAEDFLIKEGNAVMNPSVLGEGFQYQAYMPICLDMLEACDTVYMLNNWKDSKGAKLEHDYAKLQGKKIIYQPDEIEFEDFIGRTESEEEKCNMN